jgi:hypothetical protein
MTGAHRAVRPIVEARAHSPDAMIHSPAEMVAASSMPNGRIVTVGRAEFDALLGERRKRAWVLIRRQAPMPARR